MNITRIATFLTSGGLLIVGFNMVHNSSDILTRIAGGAILVGSAIYFGRQMF